MNQNVLYDFIFESNPELINLTESTVRGFKRILFIDSLWDFYPKLEVFFSDLTGIIPEQAYFLENLEFNSKLGNFDDGFLGGKYVLVKGELNETVKENFLSGTMANVLISKFINSDGQKSRSWQNTIKGVIQNIALLDFSILDSTKLFLSNTVGTDYWYQGAKQNSTFIQTLANYAYDIAHNKSPFYTFINSNEELYFMHLWDLFNQSPVNFLYPYRIELEESSEKSKYSIRDYIVQFPGMELNFDNYKIKSYDTGKSGSSSNDTHEIKDFMYKDLGSKLLIRKQYTQDVNSIIYKGINETLQDNYNYKGLVNSLFRDNALSYRMNITIPFNPKNVSGKLINIEVNSSSESKNVSKEFSGNWLITKSMHHMNMEGLAYSNLILAKSTMFTDSKHKFYNDFQ